MYTLTRNNNLRILLVLCILVGATFRPTDTHGQTKLDSIKYSKRLYISYGGVFTGSGDMWGHKLYLGANFMISPRFGIDLNVAGSLIDHVYYEYDNPKWSRNEISNGLEFSANGKLFFSRSKFRFYSALGPTIRYGYDKYSKDYGIDYNPGTGDYDWRYEYGENQGFMFGGNISLSMDYKLFKRFYIGPKGSISFFPFDAYRFSYIGLILGWK